jgi:hypothetical protein
MKRTLNMLNIYLLAILFSCEQPNPNTNNSTILTDSAQTAFEIKERKQLEKRKQIEEIEKRDSLMLDKVLKEALQIAHKNIAKNRYIKHYELEYDSIPASVEINLDYHFTNANPHLIIRRSTPGNIFIDIYAKREDKFEDVVSHKQWSLEYINDTTQDINGDGLNDLVVNWYGSSGCCLKAFSNVYIIRQDKRRFSGSFKFINPTFSPQEKIIRGICYGHPGDTEMYKYKWNGEKIDT